MAVLRRYEALAGYTTPFEYYRRSYFTSNPRHTYRLPISIIPTNVSRPG